MKCGSIHKVLTLFKKLLLNFEHVIQRTFNVFFCCDLLILQNRKHFDEQSACELNKNANPKRTIIWYHTQKRFMILL